ncbi:MAG: ABC transporter ATP-binding protein [Gorillibacterium sp.]|nr:ABC transporter ATP-binding protein [Gorillibacterium sp.]
MIHTKGLKKTFRIAGQSLPILSIPEWSVATGERIALLGPSGSGKSTLLHIIGGVLPADQGDIIVAGHSVSNKKEKERDTFRASTIGYIFQDFHLIPSLTARQNVELVMPTKLDRKQKNERIREWFERTSIASRMNHLPSQLSRGEQQRVAMIRALVNSPPLILADEPTGSLDWETAGAVMKLLVDLCREEGLTLVTVTHDLHLARLFPTCVEMNAINNLLNGENREEVAL